MIEFNQNIHKWENDKMRIGFDVIGVGVGAMIFNETGQVFLSLRGEKATNERGTWDFPGGMVEFGEPLADAIKREILEEYGMQIDVIEILGINDHILIDENQHWITPTFIAQYISGEPKILEPGKSAAIGWYDLNDLPQPLSNISREVMELYRDKFLGK